MKWKLLFWAWGVMVRLRICAFLTVGDPESVVVQSKKRELEGTYARAGCLLNMTGSLSGWNYDM